jgi:hypothetical protein
MWVKGEKMFKKYVSKTVIEKSPNILLINYYPVFVWIVVGGSIGQIVLYLLFRMVYIALNLQESYYSEMVKFVKFELSFIVPFIMIGLFFLLLIGLIITIEFNKESHEIVFIRQLFHFKKIKKYAIEDFVAVTLSETQEANEVPQVSLSFRLNRQVSFFCIMDGPEIIEAIADFMG